MDDILKIGDYHFSSRFMLGSGKTARYSRDLVECAIRYAGVELISVAARWLEMYEPFLSEVPDNVKLLPNTLGAENAEQAVEIAHMARDKGLGDLIKIEIIGDKKFLIPNNEETVKATRILSEEGFTVMTYMYPDIVKAKQIEEAGAKALMPLASPSGTSRGLATRDFIKILIDEIDLPIIVDAGIGRPSQACEAMELGADGIMMNTALATAVSKPLLARSFKEAVEAGRIAYLSQSGEV